MKKILVLCMMVLLMCSALVSAAPKEEASNPMVQKLEEIRLVLVDMLTELGIIAAKNMTVNVEPPEVNVYPEVVIPDEECEWENYYFVIEFQRFSAKDGASKTLDVYIPPDIPLIDFKATEVTAYVQSVCEIKILVNGNLAGSSCCGEQNKDIELNPDHFTMGKNVVKLQTEEGDCQGTIYDIRFASEIKSANC